MMNTFIALVIIAAWYWLIWAVNQCLKAPTIYSKAGTNPNSRPPTSPLPQEDP